MIVAQVAPDQQQKLSFSLASTPEYQVGLPPFISPPIILSFSHFLPERKNYRCAQQIVFAPVK